ncbi:hypothetical protein K466DRAFT_50772 [Polyporus arcularius HHB13444]|uniref:Uncharacterized protein n=1 Tax=Polyporus arcularius HHB13444 TaxID=1314778 RepID=A0A5C3NN17_9APHY|nr:hypothetical protein K466DRAFT_50772 [Polyporus arcularius HHB13444]
MSQIPSATSEENVERASRTRASRRPAHAGAASKQGTPNAFTGSEKRRHCSQRNGHVRIATDVILTLARRVQRTAAAALRAKSRRKWRREGGSARAGLGGLAGGSGRRGGTAEGDRGCGAGVGSAMGRLR